MKLTPLDVRHKEFKRGMRGYADDEVDEFLDEVADEFERIFKENIDLSERVEGLEERIAHYRMLEETLQKTLVSAQQSAEELKANATKEAQLILRDAELKARQMVNDSYADKQRMEKNVVILKNAQEEFRFKFRGLLGRLHEAADGARPGRQGAHERVRQAGRGPQGGDRSPGRTAGRRQGAAGARSSRRRLRPLRRPRSRLRRHLLLRRRWRQRRRTPRRTR